MLALPVQILNPNISFSKTNCRYTNIRSAKTNQRYKYHLFTNKFQIETFAPPIQIAALEVYIPNTNINSCNVRCKYNICNTKISSSYANSRYNVNSKSRWNYP